MTARMNRMRPYAIADLKSAHILADGRNGSGALVAEDDRKRCAEDAGAQLVHIRRADDGGPGADEQFAAAGARNVGFDQFQIADPAELNRFHVHDASITAMLRTA